MRRLKVTADKYGNQKITKIMGAREIGGGYLVLGMIFSGQYIVGVAKDKPQVGTKLRELDQYEVGRDATTKGQVEILKTFQDRLKAEGVYT